LGFKSLAILRNVNCHNNINSFVVLVLLLTSTVLGLAIATIKA
jgi:hypothetical protein